MGLPLGFGCAAIAVFCFGINFLPVKKYKTADGVFFQWIMCSAIFITGFIVQLARDSPPFESLAVVGGFLWCTGNIMCVTIIQLIGIGLGMLIWGGGSLIMGWACGRFGLLGVSSQSVNYPVMNIIGVLICISALGVMFFVKTNPNAGAPTPRPDDAQYSTLDNVTSSPSGRAEGAATFMDELPTVQDEVKVHDKPWVDKLNPLVRRLLGFGMAIAAGMFFGLNFNPPTHLMDLAKHASDNNEFSPHSKNALDYVFSHFTGIYITSTCYMLIYCAVKKNQPIVIPELILPAFISGSVWSIAQVCYFVANENLEFVVSFPIISTGPGIVASICGIVFFKEIQGMRNFLFLGLAIGIAIVGVTIIALSKVLS